MSVRSLLLLAASVGLGVISACDNPTCVFSGSCQEGGGTSGGGPGGLGVFGGTPPSEGAVMTPMAPTLQAVAPDSFEAHPETPIFLQFSESLNPETLEDAFVLVDTTFQQPLPTLPPTLVGDGRVVVLFPAGGLLEGRLYTLLYSENQKITDLNGQALGNQSTDPILEFAVDTQNVTEPRVIYAFPNDGSTMDGDTSELVIGFDRAMDAATFDGDSFDVTVGGVDPALDPVPEPLTIGNIAGVPPQTQVWRWRPIDGSGRVRSYGADARVVVRLSPSTNRILSEGGEELPLTESEYTTLEFSTPLAVFKPVGARPQGAYGRADVFGSGTPILEAELAAAAPSGLSAEIYLFGTSPSNESLVRSLVRTIDVPETATSFTATAGELGLVDGAGNAQFADGDFTIAVQLRRSALRTGARLLDADPDTEALELPFFDTTPPTLLGLGASGAGISTYQSSLRDFVAVGRADESISFAYVDAGVAGNNGGTLNDPPETAFTSEIPGSSEALFVCAPVPLGALDPNGAAVSYDIVVYDRAFNASAISAVGTFQQLGVVGPGAAPTGSTVGVRVVDATTLRPVSGASVFSHQESAGAITLVDSELTALDGRASVMGAGADATVLTVDASGYDLFTFHGVPRDAIDVVLTPSGIAGAAISGEVSSVFPTGNFVTSTNVVADTRAPRTARLGSVGPCVPNQSATRYICPFGPLPVRARALGGATFLATEETLPQLTFNPLAYLRGFALRAPLSPVVAGGEALNVDLDANDQLVLGPPGGQAVAIMPHVLSSAGLTNLGALDGQPNVTVEATGAGLDGPLVVGRGIPYSQSATSWTVLGAIAGVAGPAGELETRGAIDSDLFLRASLKDVDGNVVAARPRMASGGGLLDPIDVPRILLPAPGGSTGSLEYNVIVQDTLPDSAGVEGVVRLDLVDSAGRGWSLFGLDTSDAAGDLLLSVPDLTAAGGSALAAGTVSATVTMYGGAFDRGHFLYTDLERDHTLYGFAAAVTFLQP